MILEKEKKETIAPTYCLKKYKRSSGKLHHHSEVFVILKSCQNVKYSQYTLFGRKWVHLVLLFIEDIRRFRLHNFWLLIILFRRPCPSQLLLYWSHPKRFSILSSFNQDLAFIYLLAFETQSDPFVRFINMSLPRQMLIEPLTVGGTLQSGKTLLESLPTLFPPTQAYVKKVVTQRGYVNSATR
jgi:hypothetical protein